MYSKSEIEKRFDEKYTMPQGDLPKEWAEDIKQFIISQIEGFACEVIDNISKLEYLDYPLINNLEISHNKALWMAKYQIKDTAKALGFEPNVE